MHTSEIRVPVQVENFQLRKAQVFRESPQLVVVEIELSQEDESIVRALDGVSVSKEVFTQFNDLEHVKGHSAFEFADFVKGQVQLAQLG